MTTLDTTLLEQAYDAEQAGDLIRAVELRALYHSGQQARIDTAPAPSVQVEPWQSGDGTQYADFSIGSGVTRVRLGAHAADKTGVDLVIGGSCINERINEVITLADIRQLRDNLSALLADPRLGSDPLPPAPAISIERLYHEKDEDGDLTEEPIGPLAYVDYCCGDGDTKVAISFDVRGKYAPEVDFADRPSIKLDCLLAWLPSLLALLADPRVQAERARYERESATLMRKAA